MNSKLLFLIVSVLPHPFHLRDGKLPRDEASGSILPSGDSSRRMRTTRKCSSMADAV
jgi:hypothetical protein